MTATLSPLGRGTIFESWIFIFGMNRNHIEFCGNDPGMSFQESFGDLGYCSTFNVFPTFFAYSLEL